MVGGEEFEAAFGYAVGVQAAAVLVAGFALAVACLYLPFGRDAAADFDFPAVGFGLVGGAIVGVAALVASCCGGEVVLRARYTAADAFRRPSSHSPLMSASRLLPVTGFR